MAIPAFNNRATSQDKAVSTTSPVFMAVSIHAGRSQRQFIGLGKHIQTLDLADETYDLTVLTNTTRLSTTVVARSLRSQGTIVVIIGLLTRPGLFHLRQL